MRDEDRLVGGIELGGTKSIALVARGREILDLARFPTAQKDATLRALVGQLQDYQARHGTLDAIGIGSFGPLGLDRDRADYGFITSTPKPGWANVDVVGAFARDFAVPIAFDTDVNGAVLAEHAWGAAQGCDVAIYLTIGTGIGGGVIVGGHLVHGLIHPELGHVRVRRAPGDTFAGACPYHGDCLEGLASGPALAARTGLPGAKIGDDHPIWEAVSGEMAELMAQLMLALSPRRIMIGGGVFQGRAALLPLIRTKTADLLGGYLAGVDADVLAQIIVPPALGPMAGPLGAVALAYRA